MRYFRVVALVILPLALLGCSSKPRVVNTDPFLESRDSFKKNIRLLAVAPLEIPEGLPDPTPVIDEFSSLIDGELNRHGFSVVRPQQYTKTWDRIASELGDFRTPQSQERDEVKMVLAMRRTLEELGAGFELDGVVFPSIAVVEASFGAGVAVWDGVDQKIETGGVVTSFFAGSQRGVVDALSLKISIRGGDGTALLASSGGIEVLSKMVGKEFVTVPRQELFTNKDRNHKAVEVALKPLGR